MLNEVVCKESKASALFECDGVFMMKPNDIANHFSDFYMNKVDATRTQVFAGHGRLSDDIKN